MMDLMKQWLELFARYGIEGPQCLFWFEKLHKAYSGSGRHYHNLAHIETLLKFIDQYEDRLNDPDALRLAVWFHDAVYNVFRGDNEAQSATWATEALTALGFDKERTEKIHRWIAATDHKKPAPDTDTDLAFLLDIDLSVLATDIDDYIVYTEQIRREYRIFPTFLYNRGRRKALQHFLNKPTIYQTLWLWELWEEPARKNLEWELEQL